jgi:hypothetical protein
VGKAEEQTYNTLEEALSEGFDELTAQAETAEKSVDEEVEPMDGEVADGEEVAVSEEETQEGAEGDDEGQEEDPQTSDEDEEEITGEETPEYNEPPPERWPEEIREVYNQLPPAAKQAMLEGVFKPMQRQFTDATMQMSEQRKLIEPMLQAMGQYQPEFQRMGVNPIEAFQKQLAWAAHFAKVGPEQGIQDMRRAFGVSGGEDGQDQMKYLTPVERQMMERIDGLHSIVEQNQTRQTATGEAQNNPDQERLAAVRNELIAFHNETKEDGTRAFPHLERVAPAIGGLIRGGLVRRTDEYGQQRSVTDVLREAYSKACDLDPSIKAVTPKTGQVKRAKAAASVGVVAKSPSAVSTAKPVDRPITDDINEIADKMMRKTG